MKKQTFQLASRHYPEAVRAFAEENFNMKALVGLLIGIVFVSFVLVLYLVKRGPVVIALTSSGEVAQIETKTTDLQIMSAVREYISHRYIWDPETLSSELEEAKFFILPELARAFDKSMIEVKKFVREKKVSQRVYPKDITVDLEERTVHILADRITEFDDLKAATEMQLILNFQMDRRTVFNPWGVYIVKETERGPQ